LSIKILVVGPSWVGDAVMAQSLYKIISDSEDCQIDVMSPNWSQGILRRMDEVSESIVSPFEHGELNLRDRKSLGKDLQSHSYDYSIVLPNSLKSSLIPFFAKIPSRIGWLGELRYGLINDIRKVDKKKNLLMVERFSVLRPNLDRPLEDIPYPELKVDKENQQKLLKDFKIDKNRQSICLCPGAEFGPAKRWPSFYYAEIAEEYLKKGWNVFILGSLKDSRTANKIKINLHSKSIENLFDLTGETSLVDAVDILALSDLTLTNDSGLMHVAAAVGVPLVALYGPSSPEFTPPLSSVATILRKNTGYSKVRKGGAEEGYHHSLLDLKPEEVLDSLQARLQKIK
jgi:heptosyltransferase-2